jgi:hypothetical protein
VGLAGEVNEELPSDCESADLLPALPTLPLADTALLGKRQPEGLGQEALEVADVEEALAHGGGCQFEGVVHVDDPRHVLPPLEEPDRTAERQLGDGLVTEEVDPLIEGEAGVGGRELSLEEDEGLVGGQVRVGQEEGGRVEGQGRQVGGPQ